MRMSKLFGTTLRDFPADVEQPGHARLLRAGYLQPLGGGVFAALPLGEALLRRLEALVLDHLDAQHASQLIGLPQTPHRVDDAALLSKLARAQVRSYRQLPARLHASQHGWDDLPQARGGWLLSRASRELACFALLRGEEEIAQYEGTDNNQKNTDWADRDVFKGFYAGLNALFAGCELPVVRLDGAESAALEWHFATLAGDDTALACLGCGYAAVQRAARFRRGANRAEAELPLEKIATPHCPTIASLAAFLNILEERTAKAVFLVAGYPPGREPAEELIFAVVRGDRDVNEAALLRITGARALRPATDAEIIAVGAVPGYASPVGVRGARVIVDTEIPASPNLVSGANEAGFHLRNVNFGRDYSGEIAPIALAQPGDTCMFCGEPLTGQTTLRIATLRWLDPLPGAVYRAEDGTLKPVAGISARLDVQRLAAAIAETHFNEHGLRWPAEAAPWRLHLVLLGSKTGQTETLAEETYARWREKGWDCLFDDRVESPGVKFNDADLIGLPLRVTVSERALRNGGLEFKARGGEATIVALDDVDAAIAQFLAAVRLIGASYEE